MLILFLMLASSCLYAQDNSGRFKGMEEEIGNIMNAYKAAGLTVAIVDSNGIAYAHGFGYRDYEKRLPATVNTVFPLGSNTKPFTAALIGMLQDAHKVSLASRPSAYIPGLQFFNDRMNEVITVEDLLDHRSGIGGADGSFVLFPAVSRMELLHRLPFLKPGGEPRNSWLYSNFGYIILGTIAEQVSQDNWDNLIAKQIFKPLQMTHSSTSLDSLFRAEEYSLPYGVYHDTLERILYQRPENDKPGAAVNSTAKDMANWMMFWLNKGVFRQQRLLSEDFVKNAMSMKAIIDGQMPEAPQPNSFLAGYGYGWNTRVYKGHYKVDHGGAVSGFSSNVVLFPVEKFGVVVLTNQQNSSLPYVVANMISNRMLGLSHGKPYAYDMERYDIVKPGGPLRPVNKEKKPTHSLEDFCGRYEHKGYGTFDVKLEGGTLYALFPAFRFRLEHLQYNTFRLRLTGDIPQQMNPDFELNFLIDHNGTISEVNMDMRGGTIFKKITGK